MTIGTKTLTESVCTISGRKVTLLSHGDCKLYAFQSGSIGSQVSFRVTSNVYTTLMRTPSGRGAYVVAPGFDMQSAMAEDVKKDVIALAYESVGGNFIDGIFAVNAATLENANISKIGYYGQNSSIRNFTKGLGGVPIDLTSDYGALNRLRSFMHIPWLGGITGGPTLHEFVHNWANQGFISNPSDPAHWGFSSANGQLGGFDLRTLVQTAPWTWQANSTGKSSFGTFANGGNSVPYGNLELYLMGLISPSELDPVVVAINGKPSGQANQFTADRLETITSSQLVARAGQRFPSWEFSQKKFVVLFILIGNTSPTESQLTAFDVQIDEFTRQGTDSKSHINNFWAATGGKAILSYFDIANTNTRNQDTNDSQKLLDWAEHAFPSLFPSMNKVNGQTASIKHTCYQTGFCIGFDGLGNLFLNDSIKWFQAGTVTDFSAYMQAEGFQ